MFPDRLICVVLPRFSLQVCLSTDESGNEFPAVVAEENKGNAKLIAFNQRAGDFGVSLGMTVAQAGVYCPDLRTYVRNIALERQITVSVRELLQQIGPCVESDGNGVFYLEGSGLNRLYGGEGGVISAVSRMLDSTAFEFKIGVGSNKLIAGIAANLCAVRSSMVVPSGKETEFLAPLDVTHLTLPVETIAKLHELGIRKISDLGKFPAHEITLRFGDEVIALSKYARGEDPAAFLPARLTSIRMTRRIFDFSITTKAVLFEYLRNMFEEMLVPLRNTSEGARTVNILCYCQDGSSIVIPVSLDKPTSLVSHFIRQAALCFEHLELSDGITEIVLVLAEVVVMTSEQLDLESGANPGNKISERIMREFRDRAVYTVESNQKKLPEQRYSLNVPSPTRLNKQPANHPPEKFVNYTSRPVSGMRLLTQPRATTVETKDGKLLMIEVRGKRYRVMNQQGPWRLSGGWWSRGFERLYYDVETHKYQSLLIYYDFEESQWYLQGVFD